MARRPVAVGWNIDTILAVVALILAVLVLIGVLPVAITLSIAVILLALTYFI